MGSIRTSSNTLGVSASPCALRIRERRNLTRIITTSSLFHGNIRNISIYFSKFFNIINSIHHSIISHISSICTVLLSCDSLRSHNARTCFSNNSFLASAVDVVGAGSRAHRVWISAYTGQFYRRAIFVLFCIFPCPLSPARLQGRSLCENTANSGAKVWYTARFCAILDKKSTQPGRARHKRGHT